MIFSYYSFYFFLLFMYFILVLMHLFKKIKRPNNTIAIFIKNQKHATWPIDAIAGGGRTMSAMHDFANILQYGRTPRGEKVS